MFIIYVLYIDQKHLALKHVIFSSNFILPLHKKQTILITSYSVVHTGLGAIPNNLICIEHCFQVQKVTLPNENCLVQK